MAKNQIASIGSVKNNQPQQSTATRVGELQVVDGKLVPDVRDLNPGVIV